MQIKVHVTKEDIKKGQFCNQSCPEAIALRRTLEKHNIHVLDVGISETRAGLKTKQVWCEIFYAERGVLHDAAYIKVYKTFLHKKNPHLFEWIKDFNRCVRGTFVSGVYRLSNTFTGEDRNLLPEMSFVVDIPLRVIKASDYSKFVRDCAECHSGLIMNISYRQDWWHLGRTGGIYTNVTDNIVFSKLFKKYEDKNVIWDELPYGAYACGTFDAPNFRVVYIDKIKCPKHKSGDKHLIPTYEYKLSDRKLEKVVDRVLEKYKKRKGLQIMITVRRVVPYLDYIEAGVSFQFENDLA